MVSTCVHVGWQRHPTCEKGERQLKGFLPEFGKKWFKQKGMHCTYCLREGHTNSFCPATPYRPPRGARIPFVEKILELDRVKTNAFLGMEKSIFLTFVKEKGEQWNKGNPWEGSEKIYDQLRARLGFGRAIGASNTVISWLGYGVPLNFVKEPRHVVFENHKMDPDQEKYLDEDMEKQLKTGCFYPAPAESVKVSHPILVICQNCKHRRCDDCRYCNAYMANPKFKLGSLEKDIPVITEEGDEAITEDLQKAFYNVPLAKSAQPYTAFRWKQMFIFSMVMLFGMCQAPFKFTTICKPVARVFGALKIPAMSYIDDWYWPTKPEKGDGLHLFIRAIFHLLGWTFNDKGQRGTRVQLLGFVLDLVKRQFIVPHEKRISTLSLLEEFSLSAGEGAAVLVAPLQSALGKVISMSLAIPGVKVWCRSLYTQVVRTGSGAMFLNKDSVEELQTLILLLKFSEGSPFVSPIHDVDIWVDSGEVGWGAYYEGKEVSGQFTAEWVGSSSTARELQGLIHVIQALGPNLEGKVVRLYMDIMCSVRNIIKGGGPVHLLCCLVKHLWHLCEDFSIELTPRWQRRNTPLMQRADGLSKVGTEWELRESFLVSSVASHGVPVSLPDLARAQPAIAEVLRERKAHALVLPRWEGKGWW